MIDKGKVGGSRIRKEGLRIIKSGEQLWGSRRGIKRRGRG